MCFPIIPNLIIVDEDADVGYWEDGWYVDGGGNWWSCGWSSGDWWGEDNDGTYSMLPNFTLISFAN